MIGGVNRPMLPHLPGASQPSCKQALRNDDGKSNENCKKALGFKKKNNNFARASRFLVHFVDIVARLRRETS